MTTLPACFQKGAASERRLASLFCAATRKTKPETNKKDGATSPLTKLRARNQPEERRPESRKALKTCTSIMTSSAQARSQSTKTNRELLDAVVPLTARPGAALSLSPSLDEGGNSRVAQLRGSSGGPHQAGYRSCRWLASDTFPVPGARASRAQRLL